MGFIPLEAESSQPDAISVPGADEFRSGFTPLGFTPPHEPYPPQKESAGPTLAGALSAFSNQIEAVKDAPSQAIVKSRWAGQNPNLAALAATAARTGIDLGEYAAIASALPEIALPTAGAFAAKYGGKYLLDAIGKHGGERVAAWLGKWASSIPQSATAGAAFGALEPADTNNQRFENALKMGAYGPAFDLVTSGIHTAGAAGDAAIAARRAVRQPAAPEVKGGVAQEPTQPSTGFTPVTPPAETPPSEPLPKEAAAPTLPADVPTQDINRYFTAEGATPLELIRRNGGISTKELLKQDFKESLGRAGLNERTFNPLNFMRKNGMPLDNARELINNYLPEGKQLQTPAELLAYLEEHGNRPMGEPQLNEGRVADAQAAYYDRQAQDAQAKEHAARDAFFNDTVDNPVQIKAGDEVILRGQQRKGRVIDSSEGLKVLMEPDIPNGKVKTTKLTEQWEPVEIRRQNDLANKTAIEKSFEDYTKSRERLDTFTKTIGALNSEYAPKIRGIGRSNKSVSTYISGPEPIYGEAPTYKVIKDGETIRVSDHPEPHNREAVGGHGWKTHQLDINDSSWPEKAKAIIAKWPDIKKADTGVEGSTPFPQSDSGLSGARNSVPPVPAKHITESATKVKGGGKPQPPKSFDETIKSLLPGYEATSGALKEMSDGVKSLILPTSKSAEHLRAAEDVGAHLGTMHRQQEFSSKLLEKDSDAFTKMGVTDPKIPLKDNPGVKFMSDMSQGRHQPTPELQATANKIKGLFDSRVAQIRELGTGALEKVRENYFPGMWQEKTGPLGFLAKRPFEGKKSFSKQKVFDDIMDGVDAGFHPISNNPIDLVKLKLAEMDRYIMAHKTINKWKANGNIKFVGLKDKAPEGYEKINDKYGTVYAPPVEGKPATEIRTLFGTERTEPVPHGAGPQLVGHYYAKTPAAEILNNYLSSSLYNNRYFGKAYTAYMGTANALNQSQLGVGSFFHAGFTAGESQVSKGAVVIKDIYGAIVGNRSLKDVGNTVAHYPVTMLEQPLKGDKLLKEWLNPGSQNPKVQQIAKAAELAGAGFKMEHGLQTNQIEAVKRDWAGGMKLKAAARSPVAAVELMAKPIMDYLVPRQKAGLFSELAGRIIEMNPGVPLEKLTPQFRQAWNRVDARLGQVRYDRLFMNNAAKNVIQGLIRAPGWTGGTIAEVGGSRQDAIGFVKAFARGEVPKDIPDRVAYTLSLLITTAVANGAMTYALTGTQPEGMDWWAFRDGGKDDKGRPTRWLLPTYAKDLFAYIKNPAHTLVAKLHPATGIIADLIKNKNYYGVQIYHPDDPAASQVLDAGKYILKQFVPFWMRGAAKAAGAEGAGSWEQIKAVGNELATNPAKIVGPQLGIMPATSEYLNTPAQKLMNQYLADKMPIGTRTQEEFDRSQEKKQMLSALRNNRPLTAELQQKYQALPEKKRNALNKESREPGMVHAFRRMEIEEAINIWKVADDKERAQLKEPMQHKMAKAIEDGKIAREDAIKATGLNPAKEDAISKKFDRLQGKMDNIGKIKTPG